MRVEPSFEQSWRVLVSWGNGRIVTAINYLCSLADQTHFPINRVYTTQQNLFVAFFFQIGIALRLHRPTLRLHRPTLRLHRLTLRLHRLTLRLHRLTLLMHRLTLLMYRPALLMYRLTLRLQASALSYIKVRQVELLINLLGFLLFSLLALMYFGRRIDH